MSIGTFALVKNEAEWIAAHIIHILPYIDEMTLWDGGSTDGTLEIIKAIRATNAYGYKVRLREGMDPKDLRDDYVRLSDECMKSLSTDMAWFLHPDMWVTNPEKLAQVSVSGYLALSTGMRSFAGDPGGKLFEIVGRGRAWKNIYRLRNPDMGAHYFGHYGSSNEDVYFSHITGEAHDHYGVDFDRYPYEVADSGLEVLHFSDVRCQGRRQQRMYRCLINQGYSEDDAQKLSMSHPRVTLKDGDGFAFMETGRIAEMDEINSQYKHLRRADFVNA